MDYRCYKTKYVNIIDGNIFLLTTLPNYYKINKYRKIICIYLGLCFFIID